MMFYKSKTLQESLSDVDTATHLNESTGNVETCFAVSRHSHDKSQINICPDVKVLKCELIIDMVE